MYSGVAHQSRLIIASILWHVFGLESRILAASILFKASVPTQTLSSPPLGVKIDY